MMTRSRTITVGAFLVVFAAGMPVGWMFNPFEAQADVGRYAPSWLNEELDLTTAQQEQMREIWSKTAREMDGGDRMQASRDKDVKVVAILTEEQKIQYEEIMAEFRKRRGESDEGRRKRHKAAIEETIGILSSEQGQKFKELLEAQKDRGRLPMSGGARKRDGGRRP